MNGSDFEVSIILPCRNEAGTIAACIQAAQTMLKDNDIAGEIIVADNASRDASAQLAQEAGARVVPAPIRGYGNALRSGLAAAQGRYLFFLDADLSYDFEDIPKMLAALRGGAQLVIGSRFRGAIEPGAMPFLHRFLGTPAMTALANMLFGCGITDINCGLRGLHRDVFPQLNLHSEGMEFASEMMIKAACQNMRVEEIPIVLHPDQRKGAPHLHSFRDGWRHLQLMMHYAPFIWYLLPSALFLLTSLLLLILAPGDLTGLLVCIFSHLSFTVAILIMLLGLVAQGRVPGAKFLGRSSTTWIVILRKWVKVEKGVLIGFFLIILGLFLSVAALLIDIHIHADEAMEILRINPAIMKLAFGGAMVAIAGLQVFSASLFIGLFGIQVSEEELGLIGPDELARKGR